MKQRLERAELIIELGKMIVWPDSEEGAKFVGHGSFRRSLCDGLRGYSFQEGSVHSAREEQVKELDKTIAELKERIVDLEVKLTLCAWERDDLRNWFICAMNEYTRDVPCQGKPSGFERVTYVYVCMKRDGDSRCIVYNGPAGCDERGRSPWDVLGEKAKRIDKEEENEHEESN